MTATPVSGAQNPAYVPLSAHHSKCCADQAVGPPWDSDRDHQQRDREREDPRRWRPRPALRPGVPL